jgi:hypothetical protein
MYRVPVFYVEEVASAPEDLGNVITLNPLALPQVQAPDAAGEVFGSLCVHLSPVYQSSLGAGSATPNFRHGGVRADALSLRGLRKARLQLVSPIVARG